MRSSHSTDRRAGQGGSGFTLVEMLMVIAVLGLLLKTVVSNYRADIPVVALRAIATEIASQLDYLRTESRLQGGRYGMEIDVENQAYRIMLPPERRKPKEDEEKLKAGTLAWTPFENGVRLTGFSLGAKEEAKRGGSLFILFDERGRTQQKVLIFRHKNAPELVYSVTIPSLGGTVQSRKGDQGFPVATDLDF